MAVQSRLTKPQPQLRRRHVGLHKPRTHLPEAILASEHNRTHEHVAAIIKQSMRNPKYIQQTRLGLLERRIAQIHRVGRPRRLRIDALPEPSITVDDHCNR